MASAGTSVIPESHRDIPSTKTLAHIATIGPNGRPQSSPVWIDWDGTHLLFSQTKSRQKLHNLQRDPHIALSMTDPSNPYRYLEVRGTVVGETEEGASEHIDALARLYLGVDEYPFHQEGDVRVLFKIAPLRVTTMESTMPDFNASS